MDAQFQHKAHRMATGHPFSHLVCEHGARDDIANGKYGGNRGLELVINLDAAAFVHLNAHAFKIQAIGVGLATYGARSTHIDYHMLANFSRCANLVERVCTWVELLWYTVHQTLLQWSKQQPQKQQGAGTCLWTPAPLQPPAPPHHHPSLARLSVSPCRPPHQPLTPWCQV
jgi:hypothetical protein